jgi:YesN/AraC family two-component response regulator
VETAKNGAEVFKKVRAGYYSAIISDVEMPLMNGIEFYKKAREISPSRPLTVTATCSFVCSCC